MTAFSGAGSAEIDLKANVQGAIADLGRARAELNRLKSDMGGGAGDPADFAGATRGLQRAARTFALPAIGAAAVVELVKGIDESLAKVAQLEAEMAKLGTTIAESFSKIGRPSLEEFDNQIRSIRDQARDELNKLSDLALQKTIEIESRSVGGMIRAWWFGEEGPEDVERTVQETTDRIIAALEQAEDRIEKRRSEALKKRYDQEWKEFQEEMQREEEMRQQDEDRRDREAAAGRAIAIRRREEWARADAEAEQRAHETRMRNLREFQDELRRTREEIERTFTPFDFQVSTGGNAGFNQAVLARFGRDTTGRR